MKRIIYLFIPLFLISSCKQNDEAKRLEARTDIKKAKDILTQAEVEARADIQATQKYQEARQKL